MAGKIQNRRQIVLRGAREADDPEDMEALKQTTDKLGNALTRLEHCNDIDEARGIEG